MKTSFESMALRTSVLALLCLSACGGGGSGDGMVVTPSSPSDGATVTMTALGEGQLPWNVDKSVRIELKDRTGTVLSASCVAEDSTKLDAASDCTRLRGLRLGTHALTVKSGEVSVKVALRVIPQRQAFAIESSSGSVGGGSTSGLMSLGGQMNLWGSNGGARLGQGKFPSALEYLALPTPAKDALSVNPLDRLVAGSVGAGHVLALTEGGEVWSWGDGGAPLGRKTSETEPRFAAKVQGTTGAGALQGIVAVAMGEDNAMALTDEGRVYSWGYYTGFSDSAAAVPAPVLGVDGAPLTQVVGISAGWNWSAALLADGTVMTWGFNNSGSTGQAGKDTVRRATVLRDRRTGQPLGNVVAISAGYSFGLALTRQGQLFAWGQNDHGQLGQGAVSYGAEAGALPVKGLDDVLIKMAVAGGHHALALTNKGQVLSWGYSQNGELGDGANHPRVNQSGVPGAVVGATGIDALDGIVAVAAGYNVSMALRSDGTVLNWGAGFRGSLAQGASNPSNKSFVPLAVKDATGSVPLSVGPLSSWPNLQRVWR